MPIPGVASALPGTAVTVPKAKLQLKQEPPARVPQRVPHVQDPPKGTSHCPAKSAPSTKAAAEQSPKVLAGQNCAARHPRFPQAKTVQPGQLSLRFPQAKTVQPSQLSLRFPQAKTVQPSQLSLKPMASQWKQSVKTVQPAQLSPTFPQ